MPASQPDRHTPTVPTDRHAALAALRRDPVVALRQLGTGGEIELADGARRIVIGSSAASDIQLEDGYVSAVHCELERRPDEQVVVRDRRSKNGTFLDGNRVEVAQVRVGAVVMVGRTRLVALGRRSRRQASARESLIGETPAFRAAFDRAMAVAASGCSVLVAGETGTGKELFARAIHEASGRALGPFVAVNCGAIPAELVGSELFGHERGAFTGALVERDGVFVQADGGTLFLDELGELPRGQQPHLLRALETRRVQRIGGNRDRAVDIRLVAATNRAELDGPSSPLRPDLYHRIATVVIELPPLRARPGDVARLVDSFLAELEPEFGARTVDPEIVRLLAEQDWPGNVRELRHAVHRAVALSARQLRLEDLLPYRRCAPPAGAGAGARDASPTWPLPVPAARTAPPDPMTEFDSALRQVLLAAYHQHGSMRRAAAALGIPKSTFADRARRLRIR